MSLDRIVDHIAIPLTVARSLVVDGPHTARDIAYAMTAAYVAAGRQEADDGKPVSIPGNGLRYALGRSRRDRADIENGRVYRMSDATVRVDGIDGPAPLPSMRVHRFESGQPLVLRAGLVEHGDRQQQWHVDPALADAMRPGDGEPVVELPWTLVQGAKHKATLPIMLRLLAWIVDADPKWIRKRENRWKDDQHDGGHLVLQVPYAAILDSLGLTAKSKGAVVMARMLEPAAKEITKLTGYRVRFSEVRTIYRPDATGLAREGRLQAIKVEIDVPATITKPARPVARMPGAPWKPAPKFHRPAKPPEAPPAIIDNITPFPDDDDWPEDEINEPVLHTSLPPTTERRGFGSKRTNP